MEQYKIFIILHKCLFFTFVEDYKLKQWKL
jgi:hypothetical protein